jgi:hypothetical protein
MGLGVQDIYRWRGVSRFCPHLMRENVDRMSSSRKGDGRTFPRNLRSDELLARLAEEIVKMDKDRQN